MKTMDLQQRRASGLQSQNGGRLYYAEKVDAESLGQLSGKEADDGQPNRKNLKSPAYGGDLIPD